MQGWGLTNFQYLMHVNNLAGRTPNHLTQYPVFPWVLRDYASPALDLADPAAYRDLAKPMGAQDPARADRFLRRFAEWDDEARLPFHYDTLYSTPAVVRGYLRRLAPHDAAAAPAAEEAPPAFDSVAEAWASASAGPLTDVRELIPEFYYLPVLHPPPSRGGYNSDDITRVGVGGGVEPGGSDDGMPITICSFSSSDSSSSGSADTDDSELQAILAKCVKK